MSDKTTSFDDWLDEHIDGGYAQVYALYEAVKRESSFAEFNARKAANGALIVTGASGTDLVLATEAAKEAFLKLICGRYVEAGMDIGAWYGMHRGLEKD